MIDIKLETLLTVCETKNFTKASEILSLTQPAVSQHIKQLETELNVKIFNRNGSEIMLTNSGEIVVKYAKRITSLYQNLFQALEDGKRNLTRLTIGITHTAESNAVAEALAVFSDRNSGIHIIMITDTIKILYNKLKTYEIDLAIVEGKLVDKNFSSLLIDTDCLVFVMSPTNKLASKNLVTLNDIKKEKLILRLPNSGTRNLFVSHLESNNMSIADFNLILEVDNIATIKDLIRRNFGVSILPKSVCLEEIKKNKLVALPIENLSMTRDVNIIYHKEFKNLEILQDLIKIYNETVKSNLSK